MLLFLTDAFLCNAEVFVIQFDADKLPLGADASHTRTATAHRVVEDGFTFVGVGLDEIFQ